MSSAPVHPQLRSFRIEDYDTVYALWKCTEGIGLDTSDSRGAVAEFLRRNPDLSLVAEAPTGEIIGAVLCGHDGRRAFLYHLAVSPAFRKKGLGRALVDECLSRLTRHGLIKCTIHVYANNAAGRAFWTNRRWKSRDDLVVIQTDL